MRTARNPTISRRNSIKSRLLSSTQVYDLSKLEPTVRCIPILATGRWPRNLSMCGWIDAYIGSCTGGKTSDFVAFAEVVNGKRVQD